MRQSALYELYIDYPEFAAITGTYPKVDSSHGFPVHNPYEMFRDFQENTMNSDGWFAMFVVYVCAFYVIYEMYNYVLPYYWNTGHKKNGEIAQLRMKDAFSALVLEESFGNEFIELAFTPHQLHHVRARGLFGYGYDPDDVRTLHISTFNRRHKAKEHYLHTVGEGRSMTQMMLEPSIFPHLIEDIRLKNIICILLVK